MFLTKEEAVGGTTIQKKIAYHVKSFTRREGIFQIIYKMTPPYKGNDYIIASASNIWPKPEVYLFASNDKGDILDIGCELEGSTQGTLNIEAVIKDIDYEILKINLE